jgi:hypothetical protein
MLKELNLVNLQEFTSLITNIKLSAFGSNLELECIYDPQGIKLSYQLLFQDCNEIQLSIHSPENIADLEADVIDFQLGQEQHQKPAIIYTDIFELLISYGNVQIQTLSTCQTQELNLVTYL